MQQELKNFAYSFNELDIEVEHVEEAMGYGRGQSPEPFPDMIAFALGQCNQLCDIQGSLMVLENFSTDKMGSFVAEGITFYVGKKIAQQLKNADGGALFICTAGAGISEKSKELMATGDLIEGYILDVIGSITVEAAIDKIQDGFENELINLGYKMANRYSPGYCGWALSEQKRFFALFPENRCGIKLSESCLMDPIKSVSGVIGFGRNVKKTAYECQMCELETCIYRKIRLAKAR
ncbi:MAG TPA: vitamin B12 dependent-methionine synthase activation domain-containing protein [Prolixibacteraceae bacterium]|nr:vitamin B12 dependent-methionine synthase activation domain-containing protein [Prolixibacteraceae bacterium]